MKHLLKIVIILGVFICAPAMAETSSINASTKGAQCASCHEAEVKTHSYHGDCAGCHSNVAEHAAIEEARESGDAVAEKAKGITPSRPGSQQCLSCHESDKKRMHFSIAEHNKAGVQCTDCHGNHTPKVKQLKASQEKGGKTTALCATCHQDVLAKFNMPSHHPVKEGGATCTGCHDPHASKQATLGGKNEVCTKCHQAVRGPHVFEHAPVVEDCTACHDPHGSPNRKLLTVAQPMICLQCHSVAANRHGQPAGTANAATNNAARISGAALRDCVSCHGAIHGSSIDQHLRH